jgi:aspartyl-tRNA(Asn)/glutamyl-tRNA(Gln) amidotransferase subunit A
VPADTPSLLSAAELLRRYGEGTLSPVEVVDACLDAIAARNPELNAFLFVDGEGATRAAREAEARWQSGAPRGALDGVPVTVKDLCNAIGMPTRSGSLTTSEAVATEVARRLSPAEA